jgi:NADH/NAD ratio-sensing transcriptional regulator Rex
VSNNVIRRLPRYLRKLDELSESGVDKISSRQLGDLLGLTSSQVRQDFNCFGEFGQQGYGYNIAALRTQIAGILGMERGFTAILVGVGNIGRAMMENFCFSDWGVNLAAAFDIKPALIGTEYRGVHIYSMDELEKARLSDSLQAQIAELENADLRPGEEEELNARRDLLRNAEKLTEAIDEAYGSLYDGDGSALSMTQNAAYYAQRAAAITPELEQAAKSIHDAAFLLTDAAETLRDFRDSLDFSPEEYDRMETRLALFRKLERK